MQRAVPVIGAVPPLTDCRAFNGDVLYNAMQTSSWAAARGGIPERLPKHPPITPG